MQPYPGTAAPIVSTTPGAAQPGTIVSTGPSDPLGIFPVPLEVQDGDRRSAENYDTAIEGLRDGLVWCANHAIDFANGGQWLSWTASVYFANVFHFEGDVHVETPATFYILSTSTDHQVANGAVLNIGSPGLLGAGVLNVTGNGAVFYDVGSTVIWIGGTVDVEAVTWTFGSGGTMTFNNEPTFSVGALFNGGLVRTGTAAFDRYRINNGPDASLSISGTDLDTWIIPALGADRTWTLTDPVAGVNSKTRFRIRQNFAPITQLHNLTIKDSTGTTKAVFAPGSADERPACIEFEEDNVGGQIWAVVTKYDPDNHVSVA